MCGAWLGLSSLQVFGRPSQQPGLLTICTAPLASSQLGGLWGVCVCGGDSIPPLPPNPGDPASQSTQDRGGQASKLEGCTHRHAHKDPRPVFGLCSWQACIPVPMRALSGFHDKSEADRAASGSVIRAN